MLRKDDGWVKKCMEYEVEDPRPRGRPKRTWREDGGGGGGGGVGVGVGGCDYYVRVL